MRFSEKNLHMKILGLVLALGLLLLGSAENPAAQTTQQSTKSNVSPKIDSVLAQVLQMAQGGGVSSQSVQQVANRAGIPVDSNSIRVVLETSSAASGLLTAVNAVSGGTITNQSRSFIELKIPLSSNPLNVLINLAGIAGIAYIRPPLAPQAQVVSEGVSVTGASSFHSGNLRGQGIKVAVIDLGFVGLSTAQSLGELPSSAITFDFSGTGLQSTTSHGTAVAEIVRDMAPDAQLYLMKVADEVDLENAVDEAIRQGVQIINHSVGWFNTSFYDGSGAIAATAQRARSAGILWVNAAGNYAQRHWQGLALDSNSNGWVEFSGQEGLRFTAQVGQPINVFLTWRSWPTTAQDYDLFVTSTSGAIYASSERLQNGTQPPTESIFFTAPTSGTFEIRVKPLTVSSAKELSIFNLNQEITPAVAAGSIVTPGDSASALAVGSVSHLSWTTGPLQPFSSQGPTTDGRIKPDLVGPDGVSTSTAQFNPFAGTSASAPHVAGAAALLLSQNPSLGASGLETKLKSDAIPMGSSTQFGSGRLSLSAGVTARADLIIVNPSFLPANPRIGDTVVISAQISNQGNASSGAFSVQLSDSFGNTVQNFTQLAAGQTTTVSFNRQLLASSQTMTLTIDPFNQVNESNENNNTTQITVTSQTQPQPDLLVTNIDFTPVNPQVGNTMTYGVTIANQGTASAGFFSVELRDSQGLSRLNLSGLAAGSSVRLIFQRQLVGTTENITAVADVFNQVTESNENNNTRQISISAAPQLAIDVRTDRTSYQIGNPILVDFTLTGSGYVQLFDVNPNGLVTALYPLGGASGFLQAGTYSLSSLINSSLQVTGPVGFESIHAVVTSSQINFGLSGSQNSAYANTGTFQSVLTQRIQSSIPTASFALDFATFQVTSATPNQPPVSQFTFSPPTPIVGQAVTFNGTSSFDPDGSIVDYFWVFQGASRLELRGATQTVQFTTARSYTVTLTVTDNLGATGSSTQTVVVSSGQPANLPPVARIVLSTTTPLVNQAVTFDGRTSSDPDGTIAAYRWDVDGNSVVDSTQAMFSRSYTAAGTYTVTLTVFDNQGAFNTASTTVTVSSSPPPPPPSGLAVLIESVSTSQFKLTVQGDPSWNTDHNFKISLTGAALIGTSSSTTAIFTSLTGSISGNATTISTKFDTRFPVVEGALKDGKITYTIGVRNPILLFFKVEVDTDGNGTKEVGAHLVPVYVVINNEYIRVTPQDQIQTFGLQAADTRLLPFVRSNISVCNESNERCVAL